MRNQTKQYVYKKKDVIAVIMQANEKYGSGFFAWGDGSVSDALAVVERLSQKYGDLLEAPRLSHELHQIETAKMVGGANCCINHALRELKEYRISMVGGVLSSVECSS